MLKLGSPAPPLVNHRDQWDISNRSKSIRDRIKLLRGKSIKVKVTFPQLGELLLAQGLQLELGRTKLLPTLIWNVAMTSMEPPLILVDWNLKTVGLRADYLNRLPA